MGIYARLLKERSSKLTKIESPGATMTVHPIRAPPCTTAMHILNIYNTAAFYCPYFFFASDDSFASATSTTVHLIVGFEVTIIGLDSLMRTLTGVPP